MKTVDAFLAVVFLTCPPAAADEANDRSCASAAANSVHLAPGAMITASRVKNPPKVVGYPDDPTSRVVEIDVHTEAFDETYIYSCRSESGSGNVVRLLGIEDRRGR